MRSDNENAISGVSFSNANGNVYYDEHADCVCITLIGYSEGDVYRTLLNQTIELLKKYSTAKLLGDTSQSEVISVEDQDWSNNNWAKRAVEAGLRYNAIVLSEDIFGRLSIESIVDNAKVVKVKYFDNVHSAKEWLQTLVS